MTTRTQNAPSYDVMGEWPLMSAVLRTFEGPLLLLVFLFAWSSQLG